MRRSSSVVGAKRSLDQRLYPRRRGRLDRDFSISGAGIGAETARCCAKLGARLVLADLAHLEKLGSLAHELRATESVHLCDVGDRRAVEKLLGSLAPISALADTAGICPYSDDWMAQDWNETAFMKVMRVNLLGPINLARAVLPGMIAM